LIYKQSEETVSLEGKRSMERQAIRI